MKSRADYHKEQRATEKERTKGIAARIEAIVKRADAEKSVHQTKAYDIRRRIKASKVG